MTPAEYIQLKAFARVDGAMLALLWTSAFATYVMGLTNPLLAMVSLGLMLSTPFFVGIRLQRFRNVVLEGTMSFARGWMFVAYVFFYSALLFALAQYAYFAFLDHGYFFKVIGDTLSLPEAKTMLAQSGMEQAAMQTLDDMRSLRPIDIAVNMLTTNIIVGIVIGMPIAAVLKRKKAATGNNGNVK